MAYLQIRDGSGRKIVNLTIEEGEPLPELAPGEVLEPNDGLPVWRVPEMVGLWQFAGQAEAEGIITAGECEGWVQGGTVPADLLAAVEHVIADAATRRRVVLFLMGAKEFPRHHPNTVAFAAMFGKDTPDKLDDFFIAAGRR